MVEIRFSHFPKNKFEMEDELVKGKNSAIIILKRRMGSFLGKIQEDYFRLFQLKKDIKSIVPIEAGFQSGNIPFTRFHSFNDYDSQIDI